MAQRDAGAVRAERLEPSDPESVDGNADADDHTAARLLYPEDVSQQEAVELHDQRGNGDEVSQR